jgi:hypothetical protein
MISAEPSRSWQPVRGWPGVATMDFQQHLTSVSCPGHPGHPGATKRSPGAAGSEEVCNWGCSSLSYRPVQRSTYA